jgi:hypothetical protein
MRISDKIRLSKYKKSRLFILGNDIDKIPSTEIFMKNMLTCITQEEFDEIFQNILEKYNLKRNDYMRIAENIKVSNRIELRNDKNECLFYIQYLDILHFYVNYKRIFAPIMKKYNIPGKELYNMIDRFVNTKFQIHCEIGIF